MSFILFTIFITFIIRPITVFLHEMGHAIPAVLMTGKGATIYVGSYGDPENSHHFYIKNIEVWFKYNPLQWDSGLCVSKANEMTIFQQIIHVLCGPLATFLISLVIGLVVYGLDLNVYWQIFSVLFILSGWLDLNGNLKLNATPIATFDGAIHYNDGYWLRQYYLYLKYPEYLEAEQLFFQEKYTEALHSITPILTKTKFYSVQRLALDSSIQLKNFKTAKSIIDKLLQSHTPNANDYCDAAYIYSQLHYKKEPLKYYLEALHLHPYHTFALNNYGYEVMKYDMFTEAIPYFEKAIQVDPQFAFPYNNLGFAQIHLGNLEIGFQNIQHSLDLDDKNAYAYRNLGIYYFKKGDFPQAKQAFTKASNIDANIPLLDQYLNQLEAN